MIEKRDFAEGIVLGPSNGFGADQDAGELGFPPSTEFSVLGEGLGRAGKQAR